jgi:hypothetical protein
MAVTIPSSLGPYTVYNQAGTRYELLLPLVDSKQYEATSPGGSRRDHAVAEWTIEVVVGPRDTRIITMMGAWNGDTPDALVLAACDLMAQASAQYALGAGGVLPITWPIYPALVAQTMGGTYLGLKARGLGQVIRPLVLGDTASGFTPEWVPSYWGP